MDTDAPWLDDGQQQVWRRWLRLNAVLPAVLNRGLQADCDLSLPDFDVLVQLTDVATGRLRVSELAAALHWERSRLSHHVRRMEQRGLVRRDDCPDDGRGAFIVLTQAGREAIGRAAPAHVRTVRRLFVDSLTDQEFAALGTITEKLVARLDEAEADQPRN